MRSRISAVCQPLRRNSGSVEAAKRAEHSPRKSIAAVLTIAPRSRGLQRANALRRYDQESNVGISRQQLLAIGESAGRSLRPVMKVPRDADAFVAQRMSIEVVAYENVLVLARRVTGRRESLSESRVRQRRDENARRRLVRLEKPSNSPHLFLRHRAEHSDAIRLRQRRFDAGEGCEATRDFNALRAHAGPKAARRFNSTTNAGDFDASDGFVELSRKKHRRGFERRRGGPLSR